MKRRRTASRVTAVTKAVRSIKDGPSGVNADRKATILARMRFNPDPIGRLDVVEMFGIHETLASTLLIELVDEGLIYPVRTGKNRRYYLTKES